MNLRQAINILLAKWKYEVSESGRYDDTDRRAYKVVEKFLKETAQKEGGAPERY